MAAKADHCHSNQRKKNKRLGAAHERQVHAIQVHDTEGDFRHNGRRNETIQREKDESARLHVFFASGESHAVHQNLRPEKNMTLSRTFFGSMKMCACVCACVDVYVCVCLCV